MLLQEGDDGYLWPVGCVSTTKSGENWDPSEGVLRTVVYCFRKFKTLL